MPTIRKKDSAEAIGLFRLVALVFAVIFTNGCDRLTNDDCDQKTYYGPPPCSTDQACVDQYGQGWYCDKNHVVDEACNVVWPTCVKR